MAKLPGFIFYPGDYLRDTQCLSEKAQVAYDRIMCEHMRNICISQQQLKFFTKRLNPEEIEELMQVVTETSEGFQIHWVADSILKYNKFRESRSNNRKGKKKEHMKNTSETSEKHMEIEIEYVNKDRIEDSKGGTEEKKEERKGWNQMPGTDQQGLLLPEMKAGAVHQLLVLQGSKEATIEDVVKLWGVFKIQNLTGAKFYNSENDVYSHFINWSKTQKINGTHQQQPNRSNPKTAGVSKLLGSLKDDISAGRAGNPAS